MRLSLYLSAAGLHLLSFTEAAYHIHHSHHPRNRHPWSSVVDAPSVTNDISSPVPFSSSRSVAVRDVTASDGSTGNTTSSSNTNLTNPVAESDFFLTQVNALWARNNSVATTAATMIGLASGADYDFYRVDDVGNLAASVLVVFSNMTAAESAGQSEANLLLYLDTVALYLKAVTHVVNDNVGGSTRNDTLQELGYVVQSLAKASEVLDGFQTSNATLNDRWMTSADRTGLVTAWKTIMDFAISTTPQWSDGSFNYIAFTSACAGAEEIRRLASVHYFDADVSKYITWVEQMFYGFFHELPGPIINTTTPRSLAVDARAELYGGGNAVYKSWGDWAPVLTEIPSFTGSTEGSGTISDSSGYLIGDLINLGSAILMLQKQTSNDTLTSYLSDDYIQAFVNHVEYYTALFIGVVDSNTGFIPPYGDANWGDDGSTQWTLMEIAVTLAKSLNPAQASRLKFYSNMAARFTLNWFDGSYAQVWRHSLTSAWDVVASAPSTTNVTGSSILYRHSTWGTQVANKVALRGTKFNVGSNGVALIDALSSDSFGHSHAVAGNIIAHAYDSSILLRSLGYAASYDVFQNNLVVRRIPTSNTSFLSYEQLAGTTGCVSPVQPYKWSATELADTAGITGDVTQEDTNRTAHTSVTRQIITGKGQAADDGYNFHLFHHTRQVVMDKTNGALFVYDSIRANSTIDAGIFSFGQLFHVSEILLNVSSTTAATAVVAQNGPFFETRDANQQRGKPFLLQVAGGDKQETVWWSFDAEMTNYADGWANFHIHSERDIRSETDAATSFGFVSAVIPFGTDNNATAVDSSAVPADVTTSVDAAGNARAGYGDLCVSFLTNGTYTTSLGGC